MIGDLIRGLKGEVSPRWVELLHLLVRIDIPHVDVPVGPGAHGHRVELVPDGLHHLELHIKDIFFAIPTICCQCEIIDPGNIDLFNLASQK